MSDFDHIREQFRAKVAGDYLGHLLPDGTWDFTLFDSRNDYQRHLYALFLRHTGRPEIEVWATVFSLSGDVAEHKREQYADAVVHSEIVGFPRRDGTLALIPEQPVEV